MRSHKGSLLLVSSESCCHTPVNPVSSHMASQHPDPLTRFDIDRSDEFTRENKELLVKINSESILKAPTVKGSIYFYVDTHNADNPDREELIDDPSALESVSNELGIEIRHESMHHRWTAKTFQALKILEFAVIYLQEKSNQSAGNFGINAEIKWEGEQGQESIIHIIRISGNADWEVKRYC